MTSGRVFNEKASEDVGIENKEKLVKDLEAAGKLFDHSRFEGAGYDSPLAIINLHNEVWIYAAKQLWIIHGVPLLSLLSLSLLTLNVILFVPPVQ